jgi:hypothetical protein
MACRLGTSPFSGHILLNINKLSLPDPITQPHCSLQPASMLGTASSFPTLHQSPASIYRYGIMRGGGHDPMKSIRASNLALVILTYRRRFPSSSVSLDE